LARWFPQVFMVISLPWKQESCHFVRFRAALRSGRNMLVYCRHFYYGVNKSLSEVYYNASFE
jgi:hypothetical protein